jgi:hypothetical protein
MSKYTPEINDYVLWEREKFPVEGWVYFKDSDYVTIEIGVRCKDEDDIQNCPIHEKTHTLVVCYPEFWHQLKYVKTRNCVYEKK